MIIQEKPRVLLTYCQNVHAGETWKDNFSAIRNKTIQIRDRIAGETLFGLGMRLGAHAAEQLNDPDELKRFQKYIEDSRLPPFTVNGFPYGRFHGGRVKEKVYKPDWRQSERRDYTLLLAELLSQLLAEDTDGSISTVPGAYRSAIRSPEDVSLMIRHLMDTVMGLDGLYNNSGRLICLGLEPEPGCFLETTDDFVNFFQDQILTEGRTYIREKRHLEPGHAETMIRRHLGVCLDTCHLTIQFEDVPDAIERYRRQGITIAKIQISAALDLVNRQDSLLALSMFEEPVYLHQVRARNADGDIIGWPDLPEALEALPQHEAYEAVRVHFHVPLFWKGHQMLGTTARFLDDRLFDLLRQGVTQHLEIETYTFDVLPATMHLKDVTECIAREYDWVLERFSA